MRTLLLAGAGMLTALAAPMALSAQPANDPASTTATAATSNTATARPMTTAQRALYDAWTDQQRSAYDTWPQDYQTYFWTLQPAQQEGFWALTPDQQGRLYRMSPEQRALAWKSIAAQLQGHVPPTPPQQANPPGTGVPTAGVPNPVDADQPVPPAMPADESYQGGPYHGALTPPPADAMNKEYPVCTRTRQDSCRNRGGV